MNGSTLRRLTPALAFMVLSAAFLPSAGVGQEEHRVRGGEVSVYNLAGQVEVVPGSGSEVVIQVMRGGDDAGDLEVGIHEVNGRQALIVRYPSDEVVYPAMGRGSKTQIQVRSDGSFFGDGGSGSSGKVTISGSGGGLEAWADLRISVPRGQDFALFLAVGESELEGLDGTVLIDTGSGAVRARASSGELSIDTGSGEVTVEGFQGDLNVDTGSGAVVVSDIQGTGLRIDTGSGSVTGSQVTARTVEVDTGSGEIEMMGISAPDVKLDTGSGSVEVELFEDVDDLVIDTGSGSVTVWIPASVGAQVELDTGSGGIELDLPLVLSEAKRDHVEGVLGDGRGTIFVDTGSGTIRIRGR